MKQSKEYGYYLSRRPRNSILLALRQSGGTNIILKCQNCGSWFFGFALPETDCRIANIERLLAAYV